MYPPVHVPQGYRIEREEHLNTLGRGDADEPELREITFAVIDIEDYEREVTAPAARWSRRDGEWIVHPGSSTNRIEPREALARAAALTMAAHEAQHRNEA